MGAPKGRFAIRALLSVGISKLTASVAPIRLEVDAVSGLGH